MLNLRAKILLATSVVIGATCFVPLSWLRGTSSTCASAAALSDVELRTADPALVKRLAAARPFDCEVSDKPDAVLVDTSGTTRVSVYAAKEFFVLGEYLDAWIAEMHGRSYCCYTLERADAKALAGM